MTAPLTITGTYRSGTTLVERMIDQHPAASIASQPLPHLWLAAKRAHLAGRGVERDLPLGPLFRQADHDPVGLRSFLDRWPADPAGVLRAVVRSQVGFSGAMTPEVSSLPEHLPPDSPHGFAELLSWCYSEIATLTGRSGARLEGAKEIVVDEFVPYLLERGHRVVLVVRDVRAVVASSLHGAAERYVGPARPTLFTVRAWRRTAAMALAHGRHPHCHVLRYEDVLDDPRTIVEVWRRSHLPDIVPAPDPGSLTDQYGRPWGANSSFAAGGAHAGTASVDRAMHVLDEPVLAYLAAAAGPELLALGYDVEPPSDPEVAFRSFTEPVPIERPGVDPQLSTEDQSIVEELRRLELLAVDDLGDDDAREWFIEPEAHRVLRRALGLGA